MIRIQREDFSLASEQARLLALHPRIGGMVSFVGTVKDYAEGEQVVAIELSHYPGMTEAELARVEALALARFPVEALVVIHRVGRLALGEQIVLVIAAAAHRAVAFDACRYLIDHLKQYATLWKKEITAQGERWVDVCPGCQVAGGAMDHHRHEPEDGKGPLAGDWRGLSVGILTLSDSRTLAEDQSGEALAALVRGMNGEVVVRRVVPDERGEIESCLIAWSDQGVSVIVTTGGTGPSLRDVTPEATRAVADREMPGFSELIRQAGLGQVRTAALTRGVAAFRGTTLILNLPGSTRGSTHSLQAVADLVPHAIRMARGEGH